MRPASHITGMVRAANPGGPPVPISDTFSVRCLARSLNLVDEELAAERAKVKDLEAEVARLTRQLREADGEIEDAFWRSAGAA